MTPTIREIKFLRQNIPSFACKAGCHDCCGPVTTSSQEMAWLPKKSSHERDAALAQLSCPYLGEHGCEVYDERPLICRWFGTSANLACPNGCRPAAMIDPAIEIKLVKFFSRTRQVLV